jgi:hypothetical protein
VCPKAVGELRRELGEATAELELLRAAFDAKKTELAESDAVAAKRGAEAKQACPPTLLHPRVNCMSRRLAMEGRCES